MDIPAVSVIIPAYRASATIARAVRSVLDQGRAGVEILVVDDGSPDDPGPALEPFGGRVELIRKSNGGAASARNLGIERARGRFLAFLDADDHWEPNKLDRQLSTFERHPELGLVAGRYYLEPPGGVRVPAADEADSVFDEIRRRRPGLGRLLALMPQPPGRPRTGSVLAASGRLDRVLDPRGAEIFEVAATVWTSTVLVRRETLGEHRFEPGLEPAEDRDLWVRLVASRPCYLIGEPLATAVETPGSLSRSNADRDHANMLRVVRRHASLLGRRGLRTWEAELFWLWAAAHLQAGRPRSALRPALARLVRQPFSPVAWWVAAKAGSLAALGRGRAPSIAC